MLRKILKPLLILPILVGISLGYFFANAATQDNPMTYCEIVATISFKPSEKFKTYIKNGTALELYDPAKHTNIKEFYIQNNKYDIEEANWSSNGDPCKLNLGAVLKIFGLMFILSFGFTAYFLKAIVIVFQMVKAIF